MALTTSAQALKDGKVPGVAVAPVQTWLPDLFISSPLWILSRFDFGDSLEALSRGGMLPAKFD